MPENKPEFQQSWEYATYAGLERGQQMEWMNLDLEEKLAWLEEAHELIELQKLKDEPANEK